MNTKTKPMADSYWNDPAMNTGGTGYFIKMVDQESRTFTFHGHSKRPQRPETPEMFKTKDGEEFEFKFTEKNAEGVEEDRAFTAPTPKNAFVIAMKQAGIEVGDKFQITRTGAGMSTRYAVVKLTADGIPAPEEVKPVAPF